MSRNPVNTADATAAKAIHSHVARYDKDLAYIMSRLDNMDQMILEQEKLISRLALIVTAPANSQAATAQEGARRHIEMRGQCRIIQFREMA